MIAAAQPVGDRLVVLEDADAGVDPTTVASWAPDADRDGFGDDSETPIVVCDDPSTALLAYVADTSDCDDDNGWVNPGSLEWCNDGLDNDCDGTVDENCDGVAPPVAQSGCGCSQSSSGSLWSLVILLGVVGRRRSRAVA